MPSYPRRFVKFYRFWLSLLSLSLYATASGVPTSYGSPEAGTWGEITKHFISNEGTSAHDGQYDGQRLKALDPKRAAAFFMPFLAKDQPRGLRIKAIGALGWCSFQEATPALSGIAKDDTETEEVRADALDPGLRYMKNPDAAHTAASLVADKSKQIRGSAYWVLSNCGTDDAIEILEARLRSDDRPLLSELIYALIFSKHPRAGRIIFDSVDITTLLHNEDLLRAYATAMGSFQVADAQQNMLTIAQQPDHPLSAYYALLYFRFFPNEQSVPALISYAEYKGEAAGNLYGVVTEFFESPKISAQSKAKLSAFIISSPDSVASETKVRVAGGFEPSVRLKAKDILSMEDIGPVDQWTDFDIVFSLRGVPWEVTPQTFVQLAAAKGKRSYGSALVSLFSIYRWDEAKKTFVFVGNRNYRRAKGFLHEIKEGDYLVFHAQYD